MEKTFAFIGAGNMGGALIRAVCRSVGCENVFVFSRTAEKVRALSEETGCIQAVDAVEAAAKGHFVMLCVKPKDIAPVLRGIFPALEEAVKAGKSKTIVSIAGGISIAAISAVLAEGGFDFPVVRVMPNTPVQVSKGLMVMSALPQAPEQELDALESALLGGGVVERISESLIDAATPVFGCSPAYTYMFIEALADGGVMAGLPRAQAQRFAAQAVLGSAAMVLETGLHPGQLKDAVCSPGGSTIVGVEELEKSGFRAAVAAAVVEAYKKTKEIGK